jgi:hypothetical protein
VWCFNSVCDTRSEEAECAVLLVTGSRFSHKQTGKYAQRNKNLRIANPIYAGPYNYGAIYGIYGVYGAYVADVCRMYAILKNLRRSRPPAARGRKNGRKTKMENRNFARLPVCRRLPRHVRLSCSHRFKPDACSHSLTTCRSFRASPFPSCLALSSLDRRSCRHPPEPRGSPARSYGAASALAAGVSALAKSRRGTGPAC